MLRIWPGVKIAVAVDCRSRRPCGVRAKIVAALKRARADTISAKPQATYLYSNRLQCPLCSCSETVEIRAQPQERTFLHVGLPTRRIPLVKVQRAFDDVKLGIDPNLNRKARGPHTLEAWPRC